MTEGVAHVVRPCERGHVVRLSVLVMGPGSRVLHVRLLGFDVVGDTEGILTIVGDRVAAVLAGFVGRLQVFHLETAETLFLLLVLVMRMVRMNTKHLLELVNFILHQFHLLLNILARGLVMCLVTLRFFVFLLF